MLLIETVRTKSLIFETKMLLQNLASKLSCPAQSLALTPKFQNVWTNDLLQTQKAWMKSLVLKPKCKNKTTSSKLSCLNKFFLRNVRTKLLLQSSNVWTKSYFETKTLKVLLRIILNRASTQNETIWNQNVCKSFFETKKYEKKSCNETTTFQQKSCFEVKVSGQTSYFEAIMLVKILALKPKC